MSKKSASRRKPSTALVLRKKKIQKAIARGRASTRAALEPSRRRDEPMLERTDNVLGEEAALGALGLTELTIAPAEELVLAEPVPIDEVLIKPTGQPYLSHPSYTRWFNRAFGRLGWAIVPRAKPRIQDSTISCPYMLFVHGKPAAFALGEQEYHENNKEQTYGDAYEATVASALRRCAKRLGVGLELWDRPWLNRFIAEHCVKVFLPPVAEGGKKRVAWRRRVDPKIWNELATAREEGDMHDRSAHNSASTAPPAGYDGRGGEVITRSRMVDGKRKLGQVERLGIILRNSGRDIMQFKMWLVRNFGIDSRKEIKRTDYDAICQAIEAPGDLPEWRDLSAEFAARKQGAGETREPGQEG